MRVIVQQRETLGGELSLPGDKSLAHRALILGAVAEGRQVVRGLPPGEDVASTCRCLEALGVNFQEVPGNGLRIVPPRRWRDGLRLDCGNSGTTARLLAGLLGGLGVAAQLDGDGSLRRRPMGRVAGPLAALGAVVSTGPGGCLPLRTSAPTEPLRGTRIDLPLASAQVKTAVLLAALQACGPTTVTEPAPSRDHTERMLTAMGARLEREGLAVTLQGRDGSRGARAGKSLIAAGDPGAVERPVATTARLQGLDLALPGDMSTAAFFLAAGLLVGRSRVLLRRVGVNPTRTGFLEALAAMGARLARGAEDAIAGEQFCDLQCSSSTLHAVTVAGGRIPGLIDELPILAVIATQARGTTVVHDAGELRHKESDRIASTVAQLRRLGADIRELSDGFVVRGPTSLRGTAVDGGGDHRLVMALAIAGLMAEGVTTIEGAEAAAVSHPGFWDDLNRLGGTGTVRRQEAAA
jgi:3-phosphoshikimate 1-carboxyvinyltransferase